MQSTGWANLGGTSIKHSTKAGSDFRQHFLYYYNRFATLYDYAELLRKGTRRKALILSGWQPGEKVFDLCTGTGELALAYARQGAQAVDVDLVQVITYSIQRITLCHPNTGSVGV